MQEQTSTPDQIRETVRQAYGAIATRQANSCCTGPGCCGPAGSTSRQLGYSEDDLASVPDGADLGLGCGNPQAIAALKPGECVLDLGSGAGFDAFLAARQVGSTGRVIGVDMTPEMIARARANQTTIGLANVEFRQGDIEHLPVDAESVDVIMSNCVINLAPDKRAVFREAFRVLAPGGRLAISDIVALGNMPATLADDPAAYTGCVAGAAPITDIERMLAEAGFGDIRITARGDSAALVRDWSPGAERVVASALIEGVKRPAAATRGRRSPAATPLTRRHLLRAGGQADLLWHRRRTPRRAGVKPGHGRICEHVMAHARRPAVGRAAREPPRIHCPPSAQSRRRGRSGAARAAPDRQGARVASGFQAAPRLGVPHCAQRDRRLLPRGAVAPRAAGRFRRGRGRHGRGRRAGERGTRRTSPLRPPSSHDACSRCCGSSHASTARRLSGRISTASRRTSSRKKPASASRA